MLNENAKAWLKELRSNKYEQGQKYLRSEDNKYCCLGVACELAVKAGVIPKPKLMTVYLGLYKPYSYSNSDNDGTSYISGLPISVMNWLGLRDPLGFTSKRDLQSLIALNDSEKLPFSEIADFIESEPEGLFTHAMA